MYLSHLEGHAVEQVITRIGAGSMPIWYVTRTRSAGNNPLPIKNTRSDARARQTTGALTRIDLDS